MTKIKIVKAGKLNKEGMKKIGKSLLLTLAAVIIGFIADLVNIIDFGSASTIVATCLPFLVNFLKKWLGPYEVVE